MKPKTRAQLSAHASGPIFTKGRFFLTFGVKWGKFIVIHKSTNHLTNIQIEFRIVKFEFRMGIEEYRI
jgi:hypothetical protein